MTLLLLIGFWVVSGLIVLLVAWAEGRFIRSSERPVSDEQWAQFWAPYEASKSDSVTGLREQQTEE